MSSCLSGSSPDLSRVVVVGTSCSGKTTFARDLAGRLNAAHIELDALFWLPNWVERDPTNFLALVKDEARDGAWVADGNYETSRDFLWSRATIVIWLDYPFPLVFWRALKRTFFGTLFGRKVCGDNYEDLRRTFSRHSILLWVISTYHLRRRDYIPLFTNEGYPNAAKIRLKSPAEAARFLERVRPT